MLEYPHTAFEPIRVACACLILFWNKHDEHVMHWLTAASTDITLDLRKHGSTSAISACVSFGRSL
jgi:hypothetical protein